MAEIISTTKTYVLGTDNTTFFEVLTVSYDDESQDITKRRIGPAAQLAGDKADKIEGDMITLSKASFYVSQTKAMINEIIASDASILTLSGASPLAVIQERYKAALLAPGWTIDEGAGFIPIVFTVTGQGVLKYSINGAATKNASIYGAVIRLKNYPASPTDTDFYLSENGSRFFSLPNRAVTIKKP